jgi:diguanylate cyclase (GGDEF)-like protein/PAS domain S-box-containing protein
MDPRSVLHALPHQLFVKDRESTYLFCNDRYARDFGMAAEELIGKDDFALFPTAIAEKYRADDRYVIETGSTLDIEEPYVHAAGHFWVRTLKAPIKDERDEIIGVLGAFTDITARKELEGSLLANERRLSETEHVAHVGSWEMDLETWGCLWSTELLRICGMQAREQPIDFEESIACFEEHGRERLRAVVRHTVETGDPYRLELRVDAPDGLRWVVARGALVSGLREGEHTLIGTFHDVTEIKRAEEAIRSLNAELERRVAERTRALGAVNAELERTNRELARLSMTDMLTELPNRRHFEASSAREFARARRERRPVSLLFIDIDEFKAYNDHYGHLAGDECLQSVASAIDEALNRPSDMVCRYGGEEFAALLVNTDAAGARNVAERMAAAVRDRGITHEASSVAPFVTISVGTASQVPDEGASASELLERADRALYRAKRRGRDAIEQAS